ncbi:hypothetical protein PG984_008834 [Apiospora sp. TS-2023a]
MDVDIVQAVRALLLALTDMTTIQQMAPQTNAASHDADVPENVPAAPSSTTDDTEANSTSHNADVPENVPAAPSSTTNAAEANPTESVRDDNRETTPDIPIHRQQHHRGIPILTGLLPISKKCIGSLNDDTVHQHYRRQHAAELLDSQPPSLVRRVVQFHVSPNTPSNHRRLLPRVPRQSGPQFLPFPGEPIEYQSWHRVLYVKCGNVPEMMRQGLYIRPNNIAQEEGFLESTKSSTSNEQIIDRWRYIRHYYLRDLQELPRWVAHLQCHADNFRNLADMHPCELSHKHVLEAIAWAGPWPWPKATEATENAELRAPHAQSDNLEESRSPQTQPPQQEL